ncbi:uncharacterized protein [Nicotiana tomentosiformis]|uniref:uncharacterized protein n=1 Tax=Nicotiana tomentosiformis TaxID=4098 RepID=UPI00388C925C
MVGTCATTSDDQPLLPPVRATRGQSCGRGRGRSRGQGAAITAARAALIDPSIAPADEQLTGATFKQWETYERSRPVDAAPLSWHVFFVLFLEKFVPQTRREELRRQFKQLRQEDLSVTQYEMRFLELARHVVWLVPTEREKIRRFINGLNQQFRFVMTLGNVAGAKFDEVGDSARWLEMVRIQEREEKEAKRPRSPGNSKSVPSGGQPYHNKGRPYRPAQIARPVHRSASASHGSYSARCGQSSLSALPAQSSSCAPSIHGSSILGSSGSYSASRGLPQNLPLFFERDCYECGELGHERKYCPHFSRGPV